MSLKSKLRGYVKPTFAVRKTELQQKRKLHNNHYNIKYIFRTVPFVFMGVKFRALQISCKKWKMSFNLSLTNYRVNIYLLKVNNRYTRKRCEICSNLQIKTLERRQWHILFIVTFENISHFFPVFLLLTLNKKCLPGSIISSITFIK